MPATAPHLHRTWFVTGTSSGIGRQLTELLLVRGDRVAATARRTHALDDLVAEHGDDRLRVFALDVTDPAAVRRVVDEAFAAFGRVDVMVNNAGYGLFGAAEEATDEQIVRQLDTNLLGPVRVTRAALPRLRDQGGGRIVQISSIGGQVGFPLMSAYNASKWGVEGFFESLRLEVEPFGIQTTIVEPGTVRTAFVSQGIDRTRPLEAYEDTDLGDYRRGMLAGTALPFIGDPVRIARAVIDSVDRDPAPARLVLGSDAYELGRTTLVQRLADLEAQRSVAYSTDAEDARG
ncbi:MULTISPECIES: SDR family oxidoreductase [Streptomyces]|uniref:SDR family oxidoreductase n=2 Tax=Streptomyces TaxID=1883 RepID=A0A3S9PLY9_STRLT|nr:SDR family oxidoreductase [Streptomyces luteoverticillatus]AZQ73335.1 SDR family oxidoreductase [Streptomyces luteoverticillatus]